MDKERPEEVFKIDSNEQLLWIHVLKRLIMDIDELAKWIKSGKKRVRQGSVAKLYREVISDVESEWCETICDFAKVDYDRLKSYAHKVLSH